MRLLARLEQRSAVLEEGHDLGIRVEDALAAEALHLGQEKAALVHRAIDVESVAHARQIVVPAVPGRGVDDPRPGVESHVVAQHARRVAVDPGVAEAQVLEGRALGLGQRLPQPGGRAGLVTPRAPARHRLVLDGLGEEQGVARSFDRVERVVRLRVEGEGEVGGQRPGGRRPDHRLDVPARQGGEPLLEPGAFPLGQGEAHVDRRAQVVLVVLDLGLGQGRAVRDAPVHGLLGLVDEALVHELGELAHDRGLVGGRHREVGGLPFSEHPQPLELRALDVDEFQGVLPAGPAEGDRRHLPLLGAQAAVHLQLDGQAVAVPAGHVGRVVARHRPAAHHDVLEDLVEGGAEVDVAVRVGRTVVEDEGGPPLARGADLGVEPVGLPLLQAARLGLGQVGFHGELGTREIEGGSEILGRRHVQKASLTCASKARQMKALGVGFPFPRRLGRCTMKTHGRSIRRQPFEPTPPSAVARSPGLVCRSAPQLQQGRRMRQVQGGRRL